MIYPNPSLVVSRDKLRSFVPAEREDPKRWKPVQHGELADALCLAAEKATWSVEDETWMVSKDAQTLWGTLVLNASSRRKTSPLYQKEIPKGMRLELGIRHSNNGRHAIKIAVGATVVVCSNGLLTGEYVVSRKHTLNADLEELAARGLEVYGDRIDEFGETVRGWKSNRLGDDRAARLLVEAGRSRILPWSGLGQVDRLWREPPHPEFVPRNEWSFYNAFTEVVKSRSPENQMFTLSRLPRLFERKLE